MLLYIAATLLIATVSARAAALRVLAWDQPTAKRKLALVSGSDAAPITGMSPLQRTEPMKYTGKDGVAVRALDKKPGTDGKVPQIAVPIPENLAHPLVLLIPDEKHPTGLRVMVIDDDPATFRWGMFRFYNTTPTELALSLDSKAFRIPPAWKPTDIELAGENRGIAAIVAPAADLKTLIYSAVWEHDKNVRTLVFIIPGTDLRLSPVQFRAVPEDRSRIDAEPATKRGSTPPPPPAVNPG